MKKYAMQYLIIFFGMQSFALDIDSMPFREEYKFVGASNHLSMNKHVLGKLNISIGECNKITLSKNGKKIISKVIKYIDGVDSISERADSKPIIFMDINGIKIKGKDGIKFELTENCSKVSPIEFISNSKQMYRGVMLDVGDHIHEILTNTSSNAPEAMAGFIDEFGYYDETKTPKLSDEKRLKDLRNNDFSNPLYRSSSASICTRIRKQNKNDLFILFGKVYQEKDRLKGMVNTVSSLYYGNNICNENIDLTRTRFFCRGSRYPDWERDIGGYLRSEDYYEDIVKPEIFYGKKCDLALKKYEKKHKIKIPKSPFVPKEAVNLIKSGKHPGYEIWKRINKKPK